MIGHDFGPPREEGRIRKPISPPPDLRVRRADGLSAPSVFSTVSPEYPLSKARGYLGEPSKCADRFSRFRLENDRKRKNQRFAQEKRRISPALPGPAVSIQISPKKSEWRYISCTTKRAVVTSPSPGPRGKYGESRVNDNRPTVSTRFLCLRNLTIPARWPIEVRYHALVAQAASVFM